MKAAHFIVSGRVQGVGFRYYTLKQARNLDLSGWVRNLPDGSVEAFAEGPEEALETFETALRKGPSWSSVTECRKREASPEGTAGFKIKR